MHLFKMTALCTMIALLSGCAKPLQHGKADVTDAPTVISWADNAVIYEVNIRQYTKEGTFRAFEAHLPRLRALGVDILWLMPVNPIGKVNRKGTLGSYYSVSDYMDVNPEFGTLQDFDHLVQEAHNLGFKVIIDWVAYHTSWDHSWIKTHPDWYLHNDKGEIISSNPDWADVAGLDYTNKEMRFGMIDALKFWLIDHQLDGFRFDVAWGPPVDFWEEVRISLDAVKPGFMLAEAESDEICVKANDAQYSWVLLHLMNDIASGKKSVKELPLYFHEKFAKTSPRNIQMNFLTNHDENSWNGTIEERYGEMQNAVAAMIWTIPGMPLLYSGQETGLNRPLAFFEKDEIVWDETKPQHTLYSALSLLKHESAALSTKGTMTILSHNCPEQVFAFKRKGTGDQRNSEVVTICNFSDSFAEVRFKACFKGDYSFYLGSHEDVLDKKILLPPYGYLIFTK